MAIEFVKVRRKDDHTVTAEVARASLRMWAEWEPIPDDTAQPADSAETERVTQSKDPDPDTPDTKTKRRAAGTDDKGEK